MSTLNKILESMLPNQLDDLQARFLPVWLLNPVAELQPVLLIGAPMVLMFRYLPNLIITVSNREDIVEEASSSISASVENPELNQKHHNSSLKRGPVKDSDSSGPKI